MYTPTGYYAPCPDLRGIYVIATTFDECFDSQYGSRVEDSDNFFRDVAVVSGKSCAVDP